MTIFESMLSVSMGMRESSADSSEGWMEKEYKTTIDQKRGRQTVSPWTESRTVGVGNDQRGGGKRKEEQRTRKPKKKEERREKKKE